MSTVDAFYMGGVIVWWGYYLSRLVQHAQDEQFLRMPWLLLWIQAYLVGWIYTLYNETVVQHLDQALGVTAVSPTNILRVLIVSLQIVSFLWAVMHVTERRWWLPLAAVILLCVASVGVLSYPHQKAAYDLANLWIFLISLSGSCMLGWLLREVLTVPTTDIATMHLVWFVVFTLLAATSICLHALDAMMILWFNAESAASMLQIAAYSVYSLAMVSMAILTGPDHWLYQTTYPLRYWRYRALVQLQDWILAHVPVTPLHVPAQEAPRNLEDAIHQTLVTIIDYFPLLERAGYHTLYARLSMIERHCETQEQLSRAFADTSRHYLD